MKNKLAIAPYSREPRNEQNLLANPERVTGVRNKSLRFKTLRFELLVVLV